MKRGKERAEGKRREGERGGKERREGKDGDRVIGRVGMERKGG